MGDTRTASSLSGPRPEERALRRALSGPFASRSVRIVRLPSGRFRVEGERKARPVEPRELQAAAQGFAIACDRFIEVRGPATFGFTTERVAKGDKLPNPATRKLDSKIHTPLGRDENKAKLEQLRRDTGI